MKTTLCITALTTVIAAAGPEDYVNFVRQIQQDTGVEWDVSVSASGSMLSQEGVGPAGSLFQLWSIHNLTASEYHLDEEFVSSYTPSAAITVLTADPYKHVARTRVDQPFQVRIHTSGLVHGGDAPPAAGQVLLTHAAGNYPDGEHAFDGNVEGNHATLASALIYWNGQFTLNYGFTSLRGPDLTKVEGEEVWTIFALDGGTSGNPFVQGEVLQSATLQIWPIADATISGVDTVEKYETLPPISVTLNDLYPDSTTHVRVYRGAPTSSPTNASDIQSSYVIIQDSIPQNRVVDIEGIDDLFEKTGAYTMEVLHTTPFGTEILTTLYPLNIERSISIRGSIYSAD